MTCTHRRTCTDKKRLPLTTFFRPAISRLYWYSFARIWDNTPNLSSCGGEIFYRLSSVDYAYLIITPFVDLKTLEILWKEERTNDGICRTVQAPPGGAISAFICHFILRLLFNLSPSRLISLPCSVSKRKRKVKEKRASSHVES